jgi:dihydroorotate dehydrogenase electron transfer subunit
MRLFTATLLANNEISSGVHLLEMYAPELAQSAQPGQYCMLRCCDSLASDPLLRRAFFVHEIEVDQGLCRLLVYRRGRGSAWLARQPAGAPLDLLGPLGHGWTLRPAVHNLLLLAEAPVLAAVLSVARQALQHDIAVTLLSYTSQGEASYPAALLPPEVEYQILQREETPEALAEQISSYLLWADQVCCSVSRETLQVLVPLSTRWRDRHFAQVVLWSPLICASGACFSCQIETRHGSRLLCRAGPVFSLNDLVEF